MCNVSIYADELPVSATCRRSSVQLSMSSLRSWLPHRKCLEQVCHSIRGYPPAVSPMRNHPCFSKLSRIRSRGCHRAGSTLQVPYHWWINAPLYASGLQLNFPSGQALNIPVFATTQNKARLGETCPELRLDAPDGFKTVCHLDKTLFSM